MPYLSAHGRPVAYSHLRAAVGLEDLQNVYADEPGSAEMASAGRPLTPAVLARLVPRGVAVAPVVLHAGVSSPEADEPPLPERFRVPAATAALVEPPGLRGPGRRGRHDRGPGAGVGGPRAARAGGRRAGPTWSSGRTDRRGW